MRTQAAAEAGHDLMFLLGQCGHVLVTELTAGLEDLGISQRDYCVLSQAMTGEGLTQIRLAELCNLDKTTMVVTVDELEKAGLARRRPDTHDRRARIVEVTEAGRQMVADARKVVEHIYEDVLSCLPSGERTAFLHALERLAGGRLSNPVPCSRPVRRRSPKT
jgi:MarR family transcriptional regulator, transcriptional regulator for hemolysin